MAVTGFTKLIIATDEPNEHFEIDGLPPGSYSVGKKLNWKEGKPRGLGIPTVQWESGYRSLGLSVVFAARPGTASADAGNQRMSVACNADGPKPLT